MTTPQTQWALVTGASSGAGEAFSALLADRGYNLILCGRDRGRLEQVAKKCRNKSTGDIEALTFVLDLTNTTERQKFLDSLEPYREHISVLINNAGIGALGKFDSIDPGAHQNIIQLNINASVTLAEYVLPAMLSAQRGHIVNIASVYGAVPVSNQSIYAASKAFITSWTIALQREYRNSGIGITLALPGSFESRFHINMGAAGQKSSSKVSAEVTAGKILEAALSNKKIVIPGITNKAFVYFCQCMPPSFSAYILEKINSVRRNKTTS